MTLLSAAIAVLGIVDDKFSLPPKLKLLGQIVVAALVWGWVGIGFSRLWPELPQWFDCLITVFWIVGAINAFNLIDGLDGLATGIALIAVTGMAGGIFFAMNPQQTLFYFAFAGALCGFLRYNYNPASIFLGDCGSMFIGFMLSTLPLVSQAPNSFMVSVGMPLLAMGVPIFDTALAILRRLIRKLFNRRTGQGGVMSADKDHVHHRIFRAVGLNQRRAAWVLYALAASCVAVGLAGMYLDSRAGGLWLLALAIACVVVFRDLARIELFEAGRLIDAVAHTDDVRSRRRMERLSTALYLIFDIAALVIASLLGMRLSHIGFKPATMRVLLPLSVFCIFVSLVFFKTYMTAWARAMVSNYIKLLLACLSGTVLSAVVMYYCTPGSLTVVGVFPVFIAYPFLLAFFSFVALLGVRFLRPIVREIVFEVACTKVASNSDVSRVLVYGSGLRYRAFRRELVRSLAVNNRAVVGLLDDNLLLHGKYIGGVKVLGGIRQAAKLIAKYKVDAVVVACEMSKEKEKIVLDLLAPTGVKVSRFGFSEKPLMV
jgi:UDP-N-acetylmuramyl pentapeptide phosphotransferase/UDP-N-acetylglucosamine-1-phosphate transferase